MQSLRGLPTQLLFHSLLASLDDEISVSWISATYSENKVTQNKYARSLYAQFFLLLWNVLLYRLIIHYSKFFFWMNFTSTNLYKNNVNNKTYCTAKYGVSAILCRMAHAVMTAIACQCNHNISFLGSLTILFSFFPLFLQTFPLRRAGIRCCLPSDILHIRYLIRITITSPKNCVLAKRWEFLKLQLLIESDKAQHKCSV